MTTYEELREMALKAEKAAAYWKARAEKLEAALTQAQRIATENADLLFKANATIKHLTDALERRGEIIFGREGD